MNVGFRIEVSLVINTSDLSTAQEKNEKGDEIYLFDPIWKIITTHIKMFCNLALSFDENFGI